MRRALGLTDFDWEGVMLRGHSYAIPIICPESIFYAAPQNSSGFLLIQNDQLFSVLIENAIDDDFPFVASWDFDAKEDPLWDAIKKQIEEMFTYESF